MMREVVFRADASPTIGYGHFIRSLALAEMLRDNFSVTFHTIHPTQYQIAELSKVCAFNALTESSMYDDFLSCLKGNEIVVLDNYYYTTEYQKEIKSKGCKLVCIDDPHGIHYCSDLLISHGFCEGEDFDCEPYTKKLIGIDWALLRKPFRKPINKEYNRNNDIIINFGGSDPFYDTEKVVGYLLEMQLPYNIKVILGDMVYLSEEKRKRVEILKNISAAEIADLFDKSAFGIFTASTICLEGMSRGLPMLVGYDIDNQVRGYNIMAEKKLVSPLGNLLNVSKTDILKAIDYLPNINDINFQPDTIARRYIEIFNNI